MGRGDFKIGVYTLFLTLSALLVAIEEVIGLLVLTPLEV